MRREVEHGDLSHIKDTRDVIFSVEDARTEGGVQGDSVEGSSVESSSAVDGSAESRNTSSTNSTALQPSTSTTTTSTVTETTTAAGPDFFYKEIDIGRYCSAHYTEKGTLGPDECARECWNEYGCERFSTGEGACAFNCRISEAGSNDEQEPNPIDGQCATTESLGCVAYELVYYHIVDPKASCMHDYQQRSSATTVAECANECREDPSCTMFSAGPDCTHGCRISKCGLNPGESACNWDSQCSASAEPNCGLYKIFR